MANLINSVMNDNNEMTCELFEQMLEKLENGTFVPTANEGATQPLYSPYSCWRELFCEDDLAYDAVSDQYLSFISKA